MSKSTMMEIEIVDRCETCGHERHPRETWVYNGELSRNSGVSQNKLRKWTIAWRRSSVLARP